MITIDTPYNFSLTDTANSGQCFNWKQLGENYYGITAEDKYVEVRQINDRLEFSCNGCEYYTYWEHYFDFDNAVKVYQNIQPHISTNDKFLTEAYNCGKGIYILKQPFFETLISYIISQRKSIPAIKNCIQKIRENFGTKMHAKNINGEDVEYISFPSAIVLAKVSEERLKECGVGYRAKYIIDASLSYFVVGQSHFSLLNTPETIQLLKTLNGVGDKVANCVALFALHKLDACPIDTWMKKIIDEDYNGQDLYWKDNKYAGVLQQYAFFYKRMKAGKV